jgi:hypothetical protein
VRLPLAHFSGPNRSCADLARHDLASPKRQRCGPNLVPTASDEGGEELGMRFGRMSAAGQEQSSEHSSATAAPRRLADITEESRGGRVGPGEETSRAAAHCAWGAVPFPCNQDRARDHECAVRIHRSSARRFGPWCRKRHCPSAIWRLP